jgi:hypothetical protein
LYTQISGEPYVCLDLPGRLSIMFPRGININGFSLTAIDWQVGNVISRSSDCQWSACWVLHRIMLLACAVTLTKFV